MVVWFIKSDVAIRSYSKKLKVCSSHILKQRIVSFAAGLCIRIGSVRNIGILNIYIDSAEQVLVHEVTVALVIGSVQSDIFVQVHRLYMGKIQYSLFIHSSQLIVGTYRGRTGSKTKDTIRFGQNNTGDNGSCSTAQLFIILNFNYFHFTSPSLSISDYDHFNKVQKNDGIIRMLSYKNPALVPKTISVYPIFGRNAINISAFFAFFGEN